MLESLHHLRKEVRGNFERTFWCTFVNRRPPDPPTSMLLRKPMPWVVQSIRASAGTHVEANIEIGGAGVWLPRNPTGAPAHKPLFSSGAIIRASTILQPVLRPLAIRSSDPLPCFPKRSVKGLGRQPFLSLARQSGCGGNMEKPNPPGAEEPQCNSLIWHWRKPAPPMTTKDLPQTHFPSLNVFDESRNESRTSHARVTQRVTLSRFAHTVITNCKKYRAGSLSL